METSNTIGEIAKALGQFQYEVGTIKKDASNPFFKSKYATLENIIESIKDPLAKNKLTFSQFPDGAGLTTILMHESGEWMKATMPIHMGTKAQEQGSAITYARRYALSSVLGLAVDEDDDGNAASKAATTPKTASSATKAAATAHGLTERQMAAIDRIKIGLGHLGEPNDTKTEVIASVKKVTGKEFQLANLGVIGDEIWAKVEAEVDPTK